MSQSPEYLFDTNAVSEAFHRRGNANFAAFAASQRDSRICISVLTLGELRKGVAKKQRTDPLGAARLRQWVDQTEADFTDDILGVNREIATLWGQLSSYRSGAVVDTLLAATAIIHDLTLVTRNTADVQDLPIKLLNPWLP